MVTKEDMKTRGYTEPHENIFQDKQGKHFVLVDGKPTALALVNRAIAKKNDLDVDLLRELVQQEINGSKDSRLEDHGKTREVKAEVVQPSEIVPAEPVQEIQQTGTPLIVAPIVSVDEVVDNFQKIQKIKDKILTNDDFMIVGKKKIPRKSAWRKIAVPFNLNVEILKEELVPLDIGEYEWRYIVRAEAPNGRFCDGVGSCNSIEDYANNQLKSMASKMKKKLEDMLPVAISHFVRSMAMTRAESRAISDLVGGGGGIEEDQNGN